MFYPLLHPIDSENFNQSVVEIIIKQIKTIALTKSKSFEEPYYIGLSGGKTFLEIYEGLSNAALRVSLPPLKFFLIDERYVPFNDPESNANNIYLSFLRGRGITQKNAFIFPNTSLPLDECIRVYEKQLETILNNDGLDLILLGMGTDTHIASWFPPLTSLDLLNAYGDKILEFVERHEIIIFGASGNLAQAKIFPALFTLFLKNQLKHVSRIRCISRRTVTNDTFLPTPVASWTEKLKIRHPQPH
uniref:Probable 6-phosphogluconolactonase n=1 Tax=Dermatophagoides pteronyssinus TaxID=6956 RepID=A0A6P6YD09_DERPT|nr:probable 6-phosphogluconolactonase [Dermatophagoides pteronyssinus]